MFLTSNQLKSLDLNRSLSVQANAGSGKTAVLVERFVRILLQTELNKLNSIVGITFTEKAANELRSRIFRRLRGIEESEGTKDYRLHNLLERISSLQIGTIHSFCSSILHEFSNEAELDSNFSILQGIDETIMLEEIIEDSLRAIISNENEEEKKADLQYLLKVYGLKKIKGILKEFMLNRDTVLLVNETIYDKEISEILKNALSQLSEFSESLIAHSGLMEYLNSQNDWDKDLTGYISGFNCSKSIQEKCYYFDLSYSHIYSKNSGEIKKTFLKKNSMGSEHHLISIHNKIKSIGNFLDFITFFIDPKLGTEHIITHISILKKLFAIFDYVHKRYVRHKDQNAQLDFEDLLLRTRDLLKNENVLNLLRERYRYILVDEYQDTNTLQSDIIYALTGNSTGTNLFIVGDPKQSIYGFRNADVEIFKETEEIINSKMRGGKILLDESFRLLSDIVVFINFVFGKISLHDSFNKIPYQKLIKARECNNKGRVELMLYNENEKSAGYEEEMLSRRIISLINANTEIYDIGNPEPRIAEFGDIAVLLRSRTHLEALEKAFIRNNIPYLITSGIGFYQTQEVYDIFNYLSFLLNPKNDLALVGVLRSPFFYIPDNILFDISIFGNERKSFWEKINDFMVANTEITVLELPIKILKENLEISQRISIPKLINKIISETNWFGTLAIQENGKQTLANLNKFLNIARDFEGRGFNTLFDFVEKLRALIDEEDKEGQAVIDPTNQMVKIMTIHASKGLEFPIVFLPYTHQNFKNDTEPYFNKLSGIGISTPKGVNLDEEYDHSIFSKYIRSINRIKCDSEEMRVLYVAMTRAHNMLFISGKFVPFNYGRNYLSWIKGALELDDFYIRPEVEDNSNKKEKIKEPHYPFLKNDKISVTDDLDFSYIKDNKYERDIIKYYLDVSLLQGLPIEQFINNSKEEESKKINAEIYSDPIPVADALIMLSATAFQNYSECPQKYHLKYILGYPEKLVDQEPLGLFSDFKSKPSINEFEGTFSDPDISLEYDSTTLIPGTIRGKILHQALEQLNDLYFKKNDAATIIENILPDYFPDTELVDKSEKALLIKSLDKFVKSAGCSEILKFTDYYNEFNLSYALNGNLLTGSIDRLCIGENKVLIADYKTNMLSGKNIQKLKKYYSGQMLFYAYLVSKHFTGLEVESALIFLEKPDDVEFIKYSASDLLAFEERIAASLIEINKIEKGLIQPGKNLLNCSLCGFFNGNNCIY